MADHPFLFFAGSSHPELGKQIAKGLGAPLGKVSISTFPDGEIGIEILENVRGRDAFVLQTIARRPNHYLLELLIFVDALKRASARSITAVIPYFGYARQDRREGGKRVPITAKLVAHLLEAAGVDRVLVMDLHTEQIQGFFGIPVDHLFARPLLLDAVRQAGLNPFTVVAPDLGSIKLARAFASSAKADLAFIDKRRVNAERVQTGALIGNVKDRDLLLVDDMVSTGDTLLRAAEVCRERGANRIFAAATHGIFSSGAIEGSAIEKMFVTNTIPFLPEVENGVEVVSVAPLFSQALDAIRSSGSISSLHD
ncbi:MAG: Ribose-phosphate pyrophosphokinase [Chlamydiae bacterium]|nr:Ribose-phosphate pyrophosphokinase [Chlamydiota bacterium]